MLQAKTVNGQHSVGLQQHCLQQFINIKDAKVCILSTGKQLEYHSINEVFSIGLSATNGLQKQKKISYSLEIWRHYSARR